MEGGEGSWRENIDWHVTKSRAPTSGKDPGILGKQLFGEIMNLFALCEAESHSKAKGLQCEETQCVSNGCPAKSDFVSGYGPVSKFTVRRN